MRKSVYSFLVMALSAIPSAVASQAQLFEELSEKMSRWQTSEPSDEELSEFEQYKRQQLSEFADYVEEHFEEYDAFRDNVIQQWGDITVSDQAAFVTYSDDLSSRMVVDFEANELVVSIRHAADEKVSQAQLQTLYKEFIAKDRAVIDVFNADTLAVNQSETTKREVDNAARAKALIAAKKQIDSQFEQQQRYIERQTDEAIIDGEDTKLAEAQQQAQQKKLELLKQKRLKKLLETASNTGKSEATVVSEIVLKLPKQTELSKHRAERYVSQVNAQAKRFDIEPSLIFAVMHTESHFNPMAKSHIPAFGLMQIVPTSAGVDVNRMLYNRDEPMSAPYLYVTDNNIEAGTAYLNILDKRYLSKIQNPISRKYCIIAAYNTGAGNVARVFNADDSRSITKAAKIINSLSPENVLAALDKSLPYDETKHYLDKVLTREKLYIAPEEGIAQKL
ncbi:transglycosylase SLT domain-containing protein [Pseudoalteromonas piscicida]|uniref:transglycosylase SLT domain-containing protein n=1 Tax=Pseudoalteromonas piscicida TaxID=43662 RepID=UPI001C94803B|nr:murein transglycosylase domain-containing protein [Pseudoalteromonas piscicida]QZO11512.1 murein transglycosylase domain-containing protein [Pseudoalteromonas piscicida]